MFLNPNRNIEQAGLSESMTVADFGAGAGYYAYAVAEKVGNSGKVFCIDVNGDLLQKISREAAAKGLRNISIIRADLEKEKATGLVDSSIDLVLIANTLFSVARKDRVVDEAKRILKPKGRVMLIEWADSFAGMGPHQKHIVKKDQAMSLFEREGFTLDREINAGDHHYGIIFRKK